MGLARRLGVRRWGVRGVRTAGLGVAMALLLVGCGSDDSGSSDDTAATTTTVADGAGLEVGREYVEAVAADDGEDAAIQRDRDVLHGVGPAVIDVEVIDPEHGPRSSFDAAAREPGHQCRPPPM